MRCDPAAGIRRFSRPSARYTEWYPRWGVSAPEISGRRGGSSPPAFRRSPPAPAREYSACRRKQPSCRQGGTAPFPVRQRSPSRNRPSYRWTGAGAVPARRSFRGYRLPSAFPMRWSAPWKRGRLRNPPPADSCRRHCGRRHGRDSTACRRASRGPTCRSVSNWNGYPPPLPEAAGTPSATDRHPAHRAVRQNDAAPFGSSISHLPFSQVLSVLREAPCGSVFSAVCCSRSRTPAVPRTAVQR